MLNSKGQFILQWMICVWLWELYPMNIKDVK